MSMSKFISMSLFCPKSIRTDSRKTNIALECWS